MKPLRVTNIQRGCVNDGPGMRTTVFLKGCTLRCPWCCNPETQSYEVDEFIDDEKCIFLHGQQSLLCSNCERVGGAESTECCPFGVVEKTSNDYSATELLEILYKDKSLYQNTHGGVTFSGGEPLLQAEQLLPILTQLRCSGINVAFETSLVSPHNKLSLVYRDVDIWLVDVKLQPQMLLYDTQYFEELTRQLFILRDASLIFRIVFVNELWDVRTDVLRQLLKLKITKIEVLLCHNLGKKKYQRLSLINTDYTADSALANDFVCFLVSQKIDAVLLSI